LTASVIQYLRPESLSEALGALAERPLVVLSGGTDFYPARVGRLVEEPVLDISGIQELRGIDEEAEHIRIGATTTWSEVVHAPLPGYFDCLKLAAREVGGVQIQNTGTVAGNLCNASPAADGVPPLLALSAEVELASSTARRRLPLADFITGNRATRRDAGELLVAVHVPKRSSMARSAFLKLGARRYLVISIAMIAVVLDVDATGRITYAGVAVGACSQVAKRIERLEAKLLGRRLDSNLAALAAEEDFEVLSPISDVRAADWYRSEAALTLVKRALSAVPEPPATPATLRRPL
jgi:CO/xanthine dehydrogenase FAD-binding subunit